MSAWGNKKEDSKEPPAKFGLDHYRELYSRGRPSDNPIRMALVAKENCAKTGLAIDIARARTDKEIVIIDIDNSAVQTVAFNYPDDDNIRVVPLFDETDASIFDDDNTTNWTALIDKMGFFIKLIGEEAREGKIGAVIVDGGSSFLKWCELAMTNVLMNRSKNPVNVEDGDRFNQAEWRIRNQLFRDVMNRAHQLPVDAVFFTFHLKDVKQFADLGNGSKGLMKVGEIPDWEKGTMRLFSQQIFLARYTKKGDIAAGIKADPKMKDGEWEIRATIEEMKGWNQKHLGETHTILRVSGGEVEWSGLPFLEWG
ncbi:MAG: hypothetical protein Tp1100DCM51572_43 [Prokaryotic dsDNA virus sp.]|jgi:hypothetical protein|nr:MAG: hypothetical protein Tp1100DCM51572_43 [Prokaryotic dsDNA virus sp.]|tara:strand:- start:19404 stop:20336 length:933 start_codon:yes stop_codon:yes gene_type:complete